MRQNGTEGRCAGTGYNAFGERCEPLALCGRCLDARDARISGGFVESKEEFPITITAYRGNKEVRVSGVREDSVRANVDRDGNCNLSFEFRESPYRIGYIPCVDYYTTECD